MKLLGANEENPDPSNNRPQIRTSQDDAAVGYGFHQENEFPAFAPKRWPGTDDAIVDVNIFYYIQFSFSSFPSFQPESFFSRFTFCLILFINKKRKNINSFPFALHTPKSTTSRAIYHIA